jgi:hypothetical protein
MNELARTLSVAIAKDDKPKIDEEQLYLMDVEEVGYQSAFARLHSIAKAELDPAPAVTDINGFCVQQLNQLKASHPNEVLETFLQDVLLRLL